MIILESTVSMLHTLQECTDFNIFQSDWLLKIKSILNDCGLSYVWTFPQTVSTKWLENTLVQRL